MKQVPIAIREIARISTYLQGYAAADMRRAQSAQDVWISQIHSLAPSLRQPLCTPSQWTINISVGLYSVPVTAESHVMLEEQGVLFKML